MKIIIKKTSNVEEFLGTSLAEFLEIKPLYYDEIDYEYFPDLWDRIKENFKITAKVIHVVGTNGKGSTSKTIHKCLSESNVSVGSYNSPELFSYVDMYTVNNKTINKKELEQAHQFLQEIIPEKDMQKISRFEYTTLIAIKVFQDCDFMILEAGLGGEFDATNVLQKELSVITPIDMDHVQFLGNTVEKITNTKLRSVKNKLVSAKQIHEVAEDIISGYKSRYNKEQVSLTEDESVIVNEFGLKNDIPKFLINNVKLGVIAFKNLGFEFQERLLDNLLFEGRFQKVRDNIILDVGHNPMAARKIVESIANDTTLIYNSFPDKDYLEIIKILSPKLKEVILIDVPDERVSKASIVQEKIKSTKLKVGIMDANFEIMQGENYLVFGSFSVVKEFTIRYLSGLS
jgi:dihydrofolate synthase/folylpolyglutamate synthase